jgi:hypothetical protein
MKKLFLLCLALIHQTIWAANPPTLGTAPSSLLETQQPIQQFVTADPTEPPQTVTADKPASYDATTGAPAFDSPPATPVITPTQPTISTSTSIATALGLNAPKKDNNENPLAGGIDIPNFIQCKELYRSLCQSLQDPTQLEACAKRIPQSGCKFFNAFAKATNMLPKDDVDVIKHYQQLDLIHLVRFGANYPGIYYAVGIEGNLVDLIFGPQTQGLDIRKDPHYPEIANRYPKVMLFSIVERLPKVEPAADGKGLRLILRFQLLNGCHACEQAGYANIAYDFSEKGALQASTILSMEPAF